MIPDRQTRVHPERREFNKPKDVLLKIWDIFYFYKQGKVDKEKAFKQINFLHLICKRTFPSEYENYLRKEIERAKEYLLKYDKNAYEKWEEYLKSKGIEEKVESILKFLKFNENK